MKIENLKEKFMDFFKIFYKIQILNNGKINNINNRVKHFYPK